jgi:hypothetical protein
MLDKKQTAEKLKASLHTAFERWNQLQPKTNTKAELARRVTALAGAGRTCTPQDVSGWFSTGRMDKGWIGLVEHVLGEKLDYAIGDAPTIANEKAAEATEVLVVTAEERPLVLAYLEGLRRRHGTEGFADRVRRKATGQPPIAPKAQTKQRRHGGGAK